MTCLSVGCVPACVGSFDGLDPMLAWAMGSSTGHTAIAVRDPTTGELFVHESTVKDDYWCVFQLFVAFLSFLPPRLSACVTW